MISKIDKNKVRLKRHARVRTNLSGTAEKPRLNVYRSNKHIYAQIIDDVKGVTLAQKNTFLLVPQLLFFETYLLLEIVVQ